MAVAAVAVELEALEVLRWLGNLALAAMVCLQALQEAVLHEQVVEALVDPVPTAFPEGWVAAAAEAMVAQATLQALTAPLILAVAAAAAVILALAVAVVDLE
jgi:hypothetical protein